MVSKGVMRVVAFDAVGANEATAGTVHAHMFCSSLMFSVAGRVGQTVCVTSLCIACLGCCDAAASSVVTCERRRDVATMDAQLGQQLAVRYMLQRPRREVCGAMRMQRPSRQVRSAARAGTVNRHQQPSVVLLVPAGHSRLTMRRKWTCTPSLTLMAALRCQCVAATRTLRHCHQVVRTNKHAQTSIGRYKQSSSGGNLDRYL